jgi:cytochrome c-type biogenesis protein
MEQLFTLLTNAVEGRPLTALTASFVWGVLSMLLSPCHLAGIPLLVGFIDKGERRSSRRAFLISTLFAGGMLITLAAIGLVTAAAGRVLGDVGGWANYAVAGVFFLVGLHLLDVLPNPFAAPGRIAMTRKGLAAAFLLGLIFGLALGPCTFAYMAPMLGVTFKLAARNVPYGVLLLIAYGAGHCSIIVLAGTSTELVQRTLDWNERSRGALILKRLCGVLVIAGGLYLLHIAR